MTHANPLSPLLLALAGLYASENRPGGAVAAQALIAAALQPAALVPARPGPLDDELQAILAGDPHPISALVRDATPWLPWVFSELSGRIRPDIAHGMMQTELVGPDGIFPHDQVRVGLWLQSANLDYVTRAHAAEETFFILGGGAIWQAGNAAPAWQGVGALIHHPSLTPHSDCTRESPLLAAWRWTGDIAVEGYTLTG
ncbi:MAG: hypothetical protein KDK00_02350 [Rhodobacteraceae bacterium]|nr:hypothetical protein [Paracoccaceae bacterium]